MHDDVDNASHADGRCYAVARPFRCGRRRLLAAKKDPFDSDVRQSCHDCIKERGSNDQPELISKKLHDLRTLTEEETSVEERRAGGERQVPTRQSVGFGRGNEESDKAPDEGLKGAQDVDVGRRKSGDGANDG